MPQVAVCQPIVGGKLLVGRGACVHLLLRKGETVDKNTSFTFGGNKAVSHNLLVSFLTFHILERNPASPPARILKAVRKLVGDLSRRIQKFKPDGVALRFLIVYPKRNAVLLFALGVQREGSCLYIQRRAGLKLPQETLLAFFIKKIRGLYFSFIPGGESGRHSLFEAEKLPEGRNECRNRQQQSQTILFHGDYNLYSVNCNIPKPLLLNRLLGREALNFVSEDSSDTCNLLIHKVYTQRESSPCTKDRLSLSVSFPSGGKALSPHRHALPMGGYAVGTGRSDHRTADS